MQPLQQGIHVIYKKIKILEHGQHPDISHQAGDEVNLFSAGFCFFQQYPGEIIDDNGEKQDEDIHRDEEHVEHAAGQQQVQPPVFMRQQIIQDADYREK